MGENSKIEWTTHTFNPWMGCTKVSPACANCYAERDMDKRLGKVQWGPNGTRILTSDANWKKPLKWNREAKESGKRTRVFCASLADIFEDWNGPIFSNGVPVTVADDGSLIREPDCPFGHRFATMDDVRGSLFRLIDDTPYLDWLLLTKRPENIRRMWPEYPYNACLTGDCPHERAEQCSSILDRENVWLGCSVENQEYANNRVPELLKCRDLAPVLFLSCEPLQGEVDLTNIQIAPDHSGVGPDAVADDLLDCLRGEICSGETGCMIKDSEPSIDWVITGGESGPNARPSHPDWIRSLRDQCVATGVPFHFKQWGEWLPASHGGSNGALHEWRGDETSVNVGKRYAGRLLDGQEWNQFPSEVNSK